jgi:hypothetical protein
MSMKQTLSKDFIRQLQDRVACIWILANQRLPKILLKSFKIKFIGLGCA